MMTLLKVRSVLAARGESRSALYLAIHAGLFPRPVKRGQHNLWPAAEVDAVNRAETAGATREQIQALVRRLVAQRAQMRDPEDLEARQTA